MNCGREVEANFQRCLVVMKGVVPSVMSISRTMQVFSSEKDLSIFKNIMTKFGSQIAGRMKSGN